jgi:hypothetical protein
MEYQSQLRIPFPPSEAPLDAEPSSSKTFSVLTDLGNATYRDTELKGNSG